MSRGQETSVYNTATGNSKTDQQNAASSFADTNSDIGDYQKQLASFVSSNPYTKGGEFDQTINPALANVSDAGSNSLKGALQSQTMRTGQNSAANAATAATAAEQNTRNLSSDMANAQQQRIAGETGYNTTALNAGTVPINAQNQLYSTSLGGGNTALNTGQSAAATPSFWDEVGGGLAAGIGKGVSAGGVAVCWVAAELFGGWEDNRVHLLRAWIWGPFSMGWWGKRLANLYALHGEEWAALIRKNRLARWAFRRIFDRLLIRAEKWSKEAYGF